ncbi:MAG: hypothetical protein GAK28_02857 [Luteibacter sp.]|uniref:hypothetical protein n=1 Tax=Luteibacter sp. TaxID=1886636 RepID=UPI00138202F6|nr:hypothetical protein [Luteibacter sp.]KAF1005949.1 MAG: hypothetical protein GAK28_02857 [Luteibacter sp.]
MKFVSNMRCTWAMLAGMVVLGGCHHQEDPGVADPPVSQAIKPPAGNAGAGTWRAFAARVVHDEVKDDTLHPFTFAVPAGDDADAKEARRSIVMAVRTTLGNTAIPGNLLAFTGPDSRAVAAVIEESFRDLPTSVTKGVTVLYIGTSDMSSRVDKVMRDAGARLRVRAMATPE